jgi:NhaP-type Na+/H+ or K+/H+ antiporter
MLALLVVRPAAIGLALLGSRIAWREWVAAAWFGPKGFASVVYGLLILTAGVPGGEEMYHLIALVVVASILAHSSTDVLVARWFRDEDAKAQPEPAAEQDRPPTPRAPERSPTTDRADGGS